jgi:hypothetical protein
LHKSLSKGNTPASALKIWDDEWETVYALAEATMERIMMKTTFACFKIKFTKY